MPETILHLNKNYVSKLTIIKKQDLNTLVIHKNFSPKSIISSLSSASSAKQRIPEYSQCRLLFLPEYSPS